MSEIGGVSDLFHGVARAPLVSGATPLERGPVLDSGAQLWVKRDDLTGLGAVSYTHLTLPTIYSV